MYFKLFICVLLASHSLAEEEDDGQYSPEKYEKPYEEVQNEQADESQEPITQQQSNTLNTADAGAYQQNVQQGEQPLPQVYQQPIQQTLHHLAHVQTVPQAYNNPVAQQQQPLFQQTQSYQQNLQQTLPVVQSDQKFPQQLHPQLYQQLLQQQQQQKPFAVPQAYQQYAQQQPTAPQFYQYSTVSEAYKQPLQKDQSIAPQAYQNVVQQQSVAQLQTLRNSPLLQNYLQIAAEQVVAPSLANSQKKPSISQALGLQQQSQLPISATNYQTDNGHRRIENVDDEGNVIGQYSYIDPNGKTITVKYSAGKDGFKVEGDHLPKAPQPQVVQVPGVPSFPQYSPEVVNAHVSSSSVQSQINPVVVNVESQRLGIQAGQQHNTAALNSQTITTNSALQSPIISQVPNSNQNLYNQQSVQSQPQLNLQALYGQQVQATLGQPSGFPLQYNQQNLLNQQLYNPQSPYSSNTQAQFKYNPLQYNPLPLQSQSFNSP